MASKRIALICSTDYNKYPVGGMMSFVKDSAPALAEAFDVDFWGVDTGNGTTEFCAGGRTFPILFYGSVKLGPRIMPNLLRVIWGLFLSRRKLLAMNYDALYIHGIPLNLALPNQMRPKRINHVHGLNNPFLPAGKKRFGRSLIGSLYDRVRKRAVRMSDLVLLAADSQGLAPFREHNPTEGRLVKLENFCDTSVFNQDVTPAQKSSIGIPENHRLIVFVGRLSPEKDPALALRIIAALRAHPDFREEVSLVLIGDGPMRQELEALRDSLDLRGHVHFLGMQPRDCVAGWMRGADVMLLTSFFEGFPVALAEAAQCGVGIVATDITGVHDVILPGENGELVASRAPESFVPAIARALDHSDAYGRRSLEIAARYTPQIVLERLCREIADVL